MAAHVFIRLAITHHSSHTGSGREICIDFMSLRNKTLLLIFTALVLLLFLLYISSEKIILEGFSGLEEADTIVNVQRAVNALTDKITSINITLKDWAYWDDTCDFVDSPVKNPYIQSNLMDNTFINLKMNLMIFVNRSNQIVFSKCVDLDRGYEVPVSQSLKSHLLPGKILLSHKSLKNTVSGIILLDEGPMLISSKPILHTDETGPAHGVMIMGNYLDSSVIKSLSDTTRLRISIHSVKETGLPDDFQKALQVLTGPGNSVFVNSVNADTVMGYAAVNDIYNKPCLIVRVENERTIYKHGKITVFYFITVILVIGILFGTGLVIMLQKVILFRLSHLEESMIFIREKKNLSLRVPVEGQDELANIAITVNKMLDTIEESQKDLQERTVKLEDANRELRKLDELKSSFISTVSHELRTPLTSIVGFSKIIKKKLKKIFSAESDGDHLEKSKEQIFTNLDIIASEGDRLTSIINNILDMARLKSGNMELKKEFCSVYEIIDHISSSIAPLLQDKEIEFIKDIQGDLPEIMSDKYTIMQVLINLISNAIKFTDKGSIICRVKKNNSEIIFSIIDTGIGIDREHHASIFDEFKQVVNGLTNKPCGTGLGLAICRKIVEQSGGRIWVESEPGKGSNFSFTVPVD